MVVVGVAIGDDCHVFSVGYTLCYTYLFSRHLPRHSDIIHMDILR
jgi:hypothetical protein